MRRAKGSADGYLADAGVLVACRHRDAQDIRPKGVREKSLGTGFAFAMVTRLLWKWSISAHEGRCRTSNYQAGCQRSSARAIFFTKL
jgi:hypothetical protein